MKPRTRNRVAAIMLMFGVSLPAHAAPTCLAPEPACALVLLGAVVATISQHGSGEHETGDQQVHRKNVPGKVGAKGIAHADRQPGILPVRNQADNRWALREVRY